VALGAWLILRPKITGRDMKVEAPILGDVRKVGAWEATDHEIWMLAGHARLDFTDAVFPKGDATIRIIGFVAEMVLIFPETVGLAIDAAAIVSELRGFEGKQERILTGLSYQSPGYAEATQRVKVETIGFVSEIKLKRPLM
jgi:lia operon protein LiaF